MQLGGKIGAHAQAIFLAALLAIAIGSCGDRDSTDAADTEVAHQASPKQLSADGAALSAARAAQPAIETYAADHDGSYVGATAAELRAIQPVLPADLEVKASHTSYTITAPSKVGPNEFTIQRNAAGEFRLTCKVPGEGACSAQGTW